jgi:hypothetical protein
VHSKESEHEKNDCQPDAGAAGDNQDWHAGFHALTRAAGSPSGQTLEERDDQGENSQRSKRSDANQGESPERL